MNASRDSFGARAPFTIPGAADTFHIHRLDRLAARAKVSLERLPYSIRIVLEVALRSCDGYVVTEDDVLRLARWTATPSGPAHEIPFKPARVILQDFTGVPCVVDLAAMRDAVKRLGGDPAKINPLVPVDLVIDHSVQVDVFGNVTALERNAEIEFERNRERYEFLRWGQKAFRNFRVVPPATGIVHQVNLEYLAPGVLTLETADGVEMLPDSLVGTDSHTTMINGLGVVGWGVGGIEAEAVMLGQPLYMVMPEVIGFRLTGSLREGVTATDLVLTVTQMLRKKGVVDKFVEFFGPGLSQLSVADRATISNMSPEYGATMGFFPVDAETLRYLERTNRAEGAKRLEAYAKEQGLFRTDTSPAPEFTDTLSLDLADVESSLAGPKRPHDRVPLADMKPAFRRSLLAPVKERGYGLAESELKRSAEYGTNGGHGKLSHGAVVIAAITSCTNTSNPQVMIGAGLLAKKAAERGLKVPAHVKTSMAPGSKVVTEYLDEAQLTPFLQALGFHTVGYGCTTCIVEGTPVLMTDGTARRIESLPRTGGAAVFGPDEAGRLARTVQSERMNQGVRDCVSLVLQDGRTLVCTADHEILCSDGRWVRADALVVGHDRVRVGLEAPLDEPGLDEAGYVLEAGAMRFPMEESESRAKALAFARVLGHMLSDGSISVAGQGRMNAGQALDREAMLDDIERLTGQRPAGTMYDERKWTIVLPKELTAAIESMPGVVAGRWILEEPGLPALMLDPRTPGALVREFLGGLFGADGHSPLLKRQGPLEEDAILAAPAFSRTTTPENVARLREVMADLVSLLARCGVSTEGARVYTYPIRRSESTYPAASDGIPRIEVRLALPDGLSFVERVGFRYCTDKSLRATAATVYWRTVRRIGEQRLWMSERLQSVHREQPEQSFSNARRQAAAELLELEPPVFAHYSLLEGHDHFTRMPETPRFVPLHRDVCDFPSPAALMREIGAREWFSWLRPREEADYSKRYCLEKEALQAPTITLQVIDRRPAGRKPVYDLAVNDVHAFVAGTVCVHNCIGNSGPLPDEIAKAVTSGDLVAAAVLSGNRNFEGRINPLTRANYLASPPLVVAYALAGTVDIDFATEPLGKGSDGKPVYLRDLWPTHQEIRETIARSVHTRQFAKEYANVFDGNPRWNDIPVAGGDLYAWDEKSTYIHEPPFFQNLTFDLAPIRDIHGARVLVQVGDSVTTDHISPAGDIAEASPAGRWLKSRAVEKRDFNSYGSRRGNDLVMVRGTFANIRLKNLLISGSEGNLTVHLPGGEQMAIFDASERYRQEAVPLIVLAGKEYGSGSSRDWAAKGVLLLGVRAVIAESYERIHRSNLVGMGVLPLQYREGQTADSLGLTGREEFEITGLEGSLAPRMTVAVKAKRADGSALMFEAVARLDTPVEVEYFRNGGILQTVLRKLVKG